MDSSTTFLLLERASALDDLDRWYGEALAGEGRFVLVSGEAGVGKSSLLSAFTARARGDRGGRAVLWGACDPLTTPRPLGPLADLAPALGGAVEAVMRAEGAGSSRAKVSDIPQTALFRSVLTAISVADGPCVLVVEDLHWADEATLDMLRFLARRIASAPVLIVCSYRHDEVWPTHPLQLLLGDLARVASVRRLRLRPLSREAVSIIVGGSGIDPDRLHAISGGNPFFITEVIAAGGNEIPATVRDAVLARAARLPETARLVLDAAAIAIGPVEMWLLAEVTGSEPEHLDQCLRAGMLRAGPGRLAFRHELARLAIEHAVPPGRQMELHRRILTALSDRPHTAENHARLVHHAERAGDAAAVFAHAVSAGAQAAALGAHRVAAAQYARALRFSATSSAKTVAELQERHSYECYLTDQLDEAAASQQAALSYWTAIGDQLRAGDMLRQLSRIAWLRGDRASAESYGQVAVEVLQHEPPGPELAMAYSNLAQLGMVTDDTPRAIHWGGMAIDLAERLGRIDILAHALNNVGNAQAFEDPTAARAKLLRSLSLARAQRLDEHVARALANLASNPVMRRDHLEADKWLDQGLAYCTERDLDAWRMYMLAWRARSNMDRGRWSEAIRDADEVLAARVGARVTRVTALAVKARIHARQGEPGAWPLLEEAAALAEAMEAPHERVVTAVAWAEAAFLSAQPAKAQALVERSLASLANDRCGGWAFDELAFWRTRLGHDGHLPMHASVPKTSKGTPADKQPRQHTPFTAQMNGDWEEAAAQWQALGCPYEAACALADSGEDADLRTALTILHRLEARPAAAAVILRLRRMGARGISRGPNVTTRKHPVNLTRRESEVLDLVAEGLRNTDIAHRLFIATKTVDHHMSAILAKLGVGTRQDAVRAARLRADDTVSGEVAAERSSLAAHRRRVRTALVPPKEDVPG
jgi:DNA-binding CsgD family transcriptional regulator/tetratricopeptide (TPR) repeat protein